MPLLASPKPPAQSADPDKTLPLIKHISLVSLCQPAPPTSSPLGNLPLDIWNTILDFLPPLDLVTVAQLNSTFHTTVTTSLPWRFYTTLFPTSRRIWALSWKEAYDGYFARTAPPRGDEFVNFNTLNGTLPQDKTFATLFLGTNRRMIEFFGASVRHRHDTFLTQTDDVTHTCRSWQVTSTEQYSMGQVVSVKKTVVNLPPIGHHLKPAGLDVVGTSLFWVDYADSPLEYTIDEDGEGIAFMDEIGDNVLWPMGAFDEGIEDFSLLQKLFLSWGESQFEFTGQMVSARASVGERKQVLRLYDYESQRTHNISFELILGPSGPWLGPWKAPWILPWGFDDDGNLLFKILDTRLVDSTERIRCVQTSFNLASMRTTFSVEILEDIQLLNPWNFQMFSDQCWGYPTRDPNGDIWCILRDLRDGNLVHRVGPLNIPGSKPKDYSCHISMFHIIFQDKSARLKSKIPSPAPTPLRIFPIKPVPPSIQRRYHLPGPTSPQSHLLYELSPPPHPAPPGFWTFGGEDAAERYLFFQGSTRNTENVAWYDDWKKWVVWDSVRREWSVLQCRHEWLMDGFYCLFSEIDGEAERVGLDWVRMELRE